MKRPLGILLNEKIRLNRVLEELSKLEDAGAEPLEDIGEEIRRDIDMLDEALEAVEERFRNIY